jgi:MFS transporter, PPP family, 3-phenylpropionic acid transporter
LTRPPERRAVATAYFVLFLGTGVWLPYLPLWLASLGLSGWQIGVITGVQPLLRWVSALGTAVAADRWRIRRHLLVGAAATGALCFVPLLGARDFGQVLAVMTAIGLLHGPLIPLLDATVMDHLPRLGGDYGRLRLWGSLAFIVGAFASAPLVTRYTAAVVPWLLAGAVVGLAPALRHVPAAQAGHGAGVRAAARLWTPAMAAFLTAGFLIHLSSGAWNGLFAVHTRALGLPASVPGVAWGLAVVAEVALFRFGRTMLERLAPARVVLAVVLFTAVRWAATAVATREWVVIGLQLGHVVTFSVFHLAAQAILRRLVPAASSTAGQALYGICGFGLGGSAGMAIAGALAGPLGTRGVFAFEALTALLAVPAALELASDPRLRLESDVQPRDGNR